MTDDDIIEMMDWHAATTDHSHNGLLARIRRVVREAEKRQREACATLCDEKLADDIRALGAGNAT